MCAFSPRAARAMICALLLPAWLGACVDSAARPPAASSGSPPAAAGTPLASAPSATAVPAAIPITVTYTAPVLTMSGFYVAIQEGFAREEGLDPQWVQMTGTLSAQGIMARQVDFSTSAGGTLVARLRGAPIKNVFVQIDKPLYTLYGKPEIVSLADLAGKTIGVSALGDSSHLAAMAALNTVGIRPDQVTFLGNTNSTRAVAAFEAGAIAAAVGSPPFEVTAERLSLRNLGFVGEYLAGLTAGVATHEQMIQSRPDLVLAVVRAELKAHRFMQQNREGAIRHLAAFQGIDLEDAALTYDRNIQHLTRDGLSTPERLERILSDQSQELGIEQPILVEEAFDLSFARQAAAEIDRSGWRP
jgi:ABC-type nitrate/sulfonate/bicarbonate transport system substrate-binding protein